MLHPERCKLVIIGDGSCGKTCILTAFKTGIFAGELPPTIFENSTKTFQLEDGSWMELELWDTAGQEDYGQLRPISYKGVHVILVTFSIDRLESLSNVELLWAKEAQHFMKNVPIILIGNKIDLRSDPTFTDPLVSTETTEKVAKNIKAQEWFECSAKTNENIDKIFQTAGKVALQRKHSLKKSNKCTLL